MLSPAVRRRHFLQLVFSRRADEDAGLPPGALSKKDVRQRCELAFRAGETDAFMDMADWLLRNGMIAAFEAKRYADKLNEIGRYEDALAVHRRFARTEKSGYWRSLAVALAGVDQLDQANDALECAEQAGDEASRPEPAFAEALRLVRVEGPRPGQIASWPAAAALVEAYVLLGLQRRAVDVFIAVLNRSPPQGDDETLDVLRLAQEVIRLVDTISAADLMRSILRCFGQAPDRPPATAHPGVQMCQALALVKAGQDEAAVPLLAQLSGHFKDAENAGAEDARIELARTVGRLVLAEVRPQLAPGGPRKIIDIFPMNDELLMLKIKLEEMADWVDHFVIVESVLTFRGQPKPLHFERNKAEFSRFSDKIVHVVVDEFPPWASTAWTREFYQRDCGLRALARLCRQDDLVLVTDVDEIVRHSAVESFTGAFAGLGMPCYGHFFNLEELRSPQVQWAWAIKAKYLQRIGPSYAKIGLPQYAKFASMDDAGWHFSGVRDIDGLLSKFHSYSNDQWSNVQRGQLTEAVARIRQSGGAPGYLRREIDDSFPAYLREHRDELSRLIL